MFGHKNQELVNEVGEKHGVETSRKEQVCGDEWVYAHQSIFLQNPEIFYQLTIKMEKQVAAWLYKNP